VLEEEEETKQKAKVTKLRDQNDLARFCCYCLHCLHSSSSSNHNHNHNHILQPQPQPQRIMLQQSTPAADDEDIDILSTTPPQSPHCRQNNSRDTTSGSDDGQQQCNSQHDHLCSSVSHQVRQAIGRRVAAASRKRPAKLDRTTTSNASKRLKTAPLSPPISPTRPATPTV
jgi:hypothetical protein